MTLEERLQYFKEHYCNELIDKILVHQQTKVDGKKYQQIDIYYSGVGIISVSANEYEFEKEFQNILKSKTKTA